MDKKFTNFLYFILTVAALIVFLKVINWLPMALQKETLRRYSSIDEVRSKLNISDIFVPSYFPQYLSWPPSEILAQTKPFTAVVLEFKNTVKGDTALVITQASSDAFSAERKIRILQIKERVRYDLKGRNAILEAGVCSNDEPCSQISWNEGEYRIHVIMRSTPYDLIRIVDTMIRKPVP